MSGHTPAPGTRPEPPHLAPQALGTVPHPGSVVQTPAARPPGGRATPVSACGRPPNDLRLTVAELLALAQLLELEQAGDRQRAGWLVGWALARRLVARGLVSVPEGVGSPRLVLLTGTGRAALAGRATRQPQTPSDHSGDPAEPPHGVGQQRPGPHGGA